MPDGFSDCTALSETNQEAKNGWVEDTKLVLIGLRIQFSCFLYEG